MGVKENISAIISKSAYLPVKPAIFIISGFGLVEPFMTIREARYLNN
jgi:uncharacterized membrane protein YjgN (DUF898 family)